MPPCNSVLYCRSCELNSVKVCMVQDRSQLFTHVILNNLAEGLQVPIETEMVEWKQVDDSGCNEVVAFGMSFWV